METVVGLLGIFKAGGAYMPLERLVQGIDLASCSKTLKFGCCSRKKSS